MPAAFMVTVRFTFRALPKTGSGSLEISVETAAPDFAALNPGYRQRTPAYGFAVRNVLSSRASRLLRRNTE